MSDYLAAACGLIPAIFALIAYGRYKDAFHPAVFTAPLMIAGYSFWPLILNRNSELEHLLTTERLVRVQAYYLCALTTFYLGAVWTRRARLKLGTEISPWRAMSTTVAGQKTRVRLIRLSYILGAIAWLAYLSSIDNAGGFTQAYSRYKGGGFSSSGYLGEAYLLAYPAALIYALARQGRQFRAMDWIIVLVMVGPNLIQGTLGVRRGPLFISLATLFVCWIVSRGRISGLFRTGVGISLILIAVIFMWSQRLVWFSANPEAESVGLSTSLLPADYAALITNDYVSGVGSAMITEHYDGFFWGKRWWVDLLIRPIPRQLWPDKYADVGAYWKQGGNPTGFEAYQHVRVLGFKLPAGHSIGVLSDLYSEWWWGGVVCTFLLGRFLRWIWFKHRQVGQVWTAIFLAAMGLCIYLPTQSFSAWYQRLLIMAVVTLVSWRWVVGKDLVRRIENRTQRTSTGAGDR